MEPLRRLIARSQAWPLLRPLWGGLYALIARAAGWFLVLPSLGTAHVRGSLAAGEPVYGLSDIDLAVVAADEGERDAIRARAAWLARAGPLSRLLGPPTVLSERALASVAGRSALTYGIDGARGSGYAASYGPGSDPDAVRLLERPGMRGLAGSWRRICGPARSLPGPPEGRHQQRVAAWLELQHVWRSAFPFCVHRDWPQADSMCVKLVADPIAILLSLRGETPPTGRRRVLLKAAAAIPGESEAIRAALEWHQGLGRGARPDLEVALRAALRVSEAISELLSGEVAAHGTTEVLIESAGEPIPTRGPWRPPPVVDPPRGGWRLLPLADWSEVVKRCLADDVVVPVAGDAGDPRLLGALAGAAPTGPQPLLRHGSLMLMPAAVRWRAVLRSIQAPFSDPVTHALLKGRGGATFPEVPGWSAGDLVRRAVTETSAQVAGEVAPGPELEPGVAREEISRSIGAARAMLLSESLAAGEPVLTLTAEATLCRLADHTGEVAAAHGALSALRGIAADWSPVRREPVERLRQVVREAARRAPGTPSRPSPNAAGRA